MSNAEDGGQHGEWETPWPDSLDFGPSERDRLALEFAAAVRKTGSLMQLVGQAAADRLGINATDLNCLNILSFSGQLTAGELARETGLTTASITGVIDRLEEAGFVRRERDTKDRRRVVVHLNTDRAVGQVAPLFLPMMRDWRRLVQNYTDDEVRLIVGFYGQMEQVFRDQVVRLRTPAPNRSTP
jgi:DNA-binding MarR family transcriptional regulator